MTQDNTIGSIEEVLEEIVHCNGSCATNADYRDGGGYCSCGAEQRRQTILEAIAQKANKARLRTAKDIFNLAHEYAANDKTMVGSEYLREYHYYNAIAKIGEFDGR